MRGSQDTSVRLGETLGWSASDCWRTVWAGCSIGSVSDAFVNALAETTIGLYRTKPSAPTHRSDAAV